MASYQSFVEFNSYIDMQNVYHANLMIDQNDSITGTLSPLWAGYDQNYSYNQPMHLLASIDHPPPPHNMRICHNIPPACLQRHISPAGSLPSSSSDYSSCGESISGSDSNSYPIRCSASPVHFSKGHTLKMIDIAPEQNMPWQPGANLTFTYDGLTPVLPSQPHMEIDQHSFAGEEAVDAPHDFHDDAPVHMVIGTSPHSMPQPEELELSDATSTSIVISEGPTYHAKKSIKEYNTDVEFLEDEDEDALLDHDSDSDYQNQPRRRKTSRSGSQRNNKLPNSRRKSFSQNLIGHPRVHKRTQSSTSNTNGTNARANGRGKTRKGPGPVFKQPSVSNIPIAKGERRFPCAFRYFGCVAEFPNKNEWKRHVACQHLQLGFFRCDLDDCNPDNQLLNEDKPHDRRRSSQMRAKRPIKLEQEGSDSDEIIKIFNDFNRKDLFTQHCRRMHGPSRNPSLCSAKNKKGVCMPTKEDEMAFEKDLDNIRTRCWHVRRKAPSRVNCGFCSRLFDASYFGAATATSAPDALGAEDKAWEEYMEHVGKHFERGDVNIDEEDIDQDFIQWGLNTGVLRTLDNGNPWLVSVDPPSATDQNEGIQENNDRQAEEKKKARRQPRRTVVIEKRKHYDASATSSSSISDSSPPVKSSAESEISDEDADAETE